MGAVLVENDAAGEVEAAAEGVEIEQQALVLQLGLGIRGGVVLFEVQPEMEDVDATADAEQVMRIVKIDTGADAQSGQTERDGRCGDPGGARWAGVGLRAVPDQRGGYGHGGAGCKFVHVHGWRLSGGC